MAAFILLLLFVGVVKSLITTPTSKATLPTWNFFTMKFSSHHFSTLIRCSRLSRIKKTTVVPQRERNLDQLNISPSLSSHVSDYNYSTF